MLEGTQHCPDNAALEIQMKYQSDSQRGRDTHMP